MLKQLKRHHHVTYLCFRTPSDPPGAVSRATEFSDELITVDMQPVLSGTAMFFLGVAWNSLFGRVPFFAKKYQSPEMEAHIRRLTEAGQVDLVVADYLASMIHFHGSGKKPSKPLLIFQHNVESQIWKRHAETATNAIKAAVFRKQWKLTCNWERECDEIADGQVTVSDDDCRFLREHFGLKKILGDVPTGVDLDFFTPPTEPRKPHSLVFLGSMDWTANIDGTLFAVEEILPRVRQVFPDLTLTIVGRNPPP